MVEVMREQKPESGRGNETTEAGNVAWESD